MIRAKIIPIMALVSVTLAACVLSEPLEEGSFYAQNMISKNFYEVKAKLLWTGEKCVIWAETGSGVTPAQAENIAREYDAVIRPRIVGAFSEKDFTYNYNGKEYHFDDMLNFANWLVDGGDGRLTILLLDIKDNYENTGSYVAGYFFNGDFWPRGKIDSDHYSNGRDMIYIDTHPGLSARPRQAFTTFAHELQHLINFVTFLWSDKDNLTDVWVNEGLSAYAEYLYLGENPPDKCEWFSNNSKTIAKGNNFFVWDNHEHDPYAILDDYATVYLFFRWLYLQADAELQPDIFRNMVHSEYHDYRAVTAIASAINPAWSDWKTLLQAWFAANSYPQNQAGYTGDPYLEEIIKVTPVAENTLSLYPGEGVYSIINGSYSTAGGPNIRYAEVAGKTGIVNTLLTFNANTDKSKGSETGYLTGVAASVAVPSASPTEAKNRQAGKESGPYVIDAGDMLGRDRDGPKYRLPR